MLKGDALQRAASLQADRVQGPGGVLVVADGDDDCAVDLSARLRDAAKPIPIEVTVAVREFEAWFLAAAQSLRKHRYVRDDALYLGDPESVRDAKGAINNLMIQPYHETLHQPAFSSVMSIEEGRTARSFDHLVTCIGRLLGR